VSECSDVSFQHCTCGVLERREKQDEIKKTDTELASDRKWEEEKLVGEKAPSTNSIFLDSSEEKKKETEVI